MTIEELEEYQKTIREAITKQGFFIQGVNEIEDDETTGYCYTIGLTEKGIPDIYLDAPGKFLGHVLSHVAQKLLTGEIKSERIYSVPFLECVVTREDTRYILLPIQEEDRYKLPGIFNRYSDINRHTWPLKLVLGDKYNNLDIPL